MTGFTPDGGSAPVVDNPCALLSALRAAYYQLLTGQARAQVRNGDQWLTWHRSDVKTLQHEIRRLESICEAGVNVGRAVRVGPYVLSHRPHRYRY
ncbi:hypothetical protein ABIB90_002747 [Bradyrhizobium sp. JR4.1]|uniref:gpW family head-tail joining protein n=1 Tax=Bradyrhizobium sp. JR4.1 TaxID=3156372 RepID=UPI00339AF212